jgi:hypothetical protein
MWIPGTLVECVQPVYQGSRNETVPVVGVVYTVREWVPDIPSYPDGKLRDCVRLDEIRNPVYRYRHGRAEAAFICRHFRPLSDSRLDVFRSLLADLPQDAEPVA